MKYEKTQNDHREHKQNLQNSNITQDGLEDSFNAELIKLMKSVRPYSNQLAVPKYGLILPMCSSSDLVRPASEFSERFVCESF